MASKTVFTQVQGTLSALVGEKCWTYNVTFGTEARKFRGSRGIDQAVSRVSLAPGHRVPDGRPYTARYRYHGKRYESTGLRVDAGQLLVDGVGSRTA
jgi:hypothetical protein